MYNCPVCGYPYLHTAPEDDGTICPCCGIHFAYEGYGFDKNQDIVTVATYRVEWILNGSKWWSSYTKPPFGWCPIKQLDKTQEL